MAAAGAILGLIGTGLQIYGQIQQTKILKQQEAERKKQLNLDALRQRREIARNAAMARAQALASANAQGAIGGSGLQGGYGQITGRAAGQTLAVNQNQEIGNKMFDLNQKYYNASIFTDIGSGLFSLGGSLINNAGTFQRVGYSMGF